MILVDSKKHGHLQQQKQKQHAQMNTKNKMIPTNEVKEQDDSDDGSSVQCISCREQ